MKKILALIGSPRGAGNSVTMARAVCRNVQEKHELKLMRLSDFNLQPCRACYRCLFQDRKCIINDDLEMIIQALEEADALIIAAPTYFLGANGVLKMLMDRGLAFYSHADKLWGKPSIGIGITGIRGKEGSTLLDIQKFQKILMADIKHTVIVYGALPGEVFLDDNNIKTAEMLGKLLFGEAHVSTGPNCTQCGSDTFRFIDDRRVRCMLCSNEGTVEFVNGKPIFSINSSEHELFLTREYALQHEKWLVEMKDRYMEKRDELGEITREYIGDGKWIKPVKE